MIEELCGTLKGPLIEKIKIAANYNSANSLGISGPAAAVQGKLPQVYFAPQTCSIQIQTDLITNEPLNALLIF